ncbi:hypothetical protein [Paenibacillus sp. P36]
MTEKQGTTYPTAASFGVDVVNESFVNIYVGADLMHLSENNP